MNYSRLLYSIVLSPDECDTEAPTEHQIAGYYFLSPREIFIPDFVVSRKKGVEKIATIEIKAKLELSSNQMSKLVKNHYHLFTRISNSKQVSFSSDDLNSLSQDELENTNIALMRITNSDHKKKGISNIEPDGEYTTAGKTTVPFFNSSKASSVLGLESWDEYTKSKGIIYEKYISDNMELLHRIRNDIKDSLLTNNLRKMNIDPQSPTSFEYDNMIKNNPKFERAMKKYQKFNQKLHGLVVTTAYNCVPYIIEFVDIFQTPFSLISGKRTFLKFYAETWEITKCNKEQPMFQARFADFHSKSRKPLKNVDEAGKSFLAMRYTYQQCNKIRHLIEQFSDEPKITNVYFEYLVSFQLLRVKLSLRKGAVLLPDQCQLSSMSPRVITIGRTLARCLRYTQEVTDRYQKLNDLEQKLGLNFNDKLLLRQAFTHTTFSIENETKLTDNQRLEYLGDAVLDYIVSQYLFSRYPSAPEGMLTEMRVHIVRNKHLEPIAKDKMKLFNYLIYPERQESLKKEARRVCADTFEALLGALYIDKGCKAAIHFCNHWIFDEQCLQDLDKIGQCSKAEPLPNRELPPFELVPELLQQVEAILGYEFKGDKTLLVEALTHSSWRSGFGLPPKDDHLNRFNYERLEYLGDALLKFIVSNYLYINYPKASEEQLTLVRHETVDNLKSLPRAAEAMQLHPYILHHLPPNTILKGNTTYKNLLSDVFEALIGAIFVDSNYQLDGTKENPFFLDVQGRMIYRYLIGRTDTNPKTFSSPSKSVVQNYVQQLCSQLPYYKFIDEKPEKGFSIFTIQITIPPPKGTNGEGAIGDGICLAKGRGTSKKQAENEAARKAVPLVEKVLHKLEPKTGKMMTFEKIQDIVSSFYDTFPDLFNVETDEEIRNQVMSTTSKSVFGMLKSMKESNKKQGLNYEKHIFRMEGMDNSNLCNLRQKLSSQFGALKNDNLIQFASGVAEEIPKQKKKRKKKRKPKLKKEKQEENNKCK
eukprot:gb/GECH01013802.1/.p1 GENE.gb/GECH01013802.1/~~gb/GECH01013802.1/.p1  ORF type:complete len:985 (+),score=166.02 gb/GECH01013802.1/:1-2955(+)